MSKTVIFEHLLNPVFALVGNFCILEFSHDQYTLLEQFHSSSSLTLSQIDRIYQSLSTRKKLVSLKLNRFFIYKEKRIISGKILIYILDTSRVGFRTNEPSGLLHFCYNVSFHVNLPRIIFREFLYKFHTIKKNTLLLVFTLASA